ncbi:MAG: flagella basal body P-ring formation protein FlgA [Xanthomonadaceae bacterium]|nr:flagella basal body P-ring formation protein FlgA [Xanthomonadaceae bacterium]
MSRRATPKPAVVALLAALVGLLLMSTARADAGVESASRIREAAERYVTAQVPSTATVTAEALDNRLRLPACARPLDTSAANPAARGAWSILVSCRDNGAALWAVFVPVKVADLRSVVVMSRSVAPGQPISAELLRLEKRDVATLSMGYLSSIDEAVGRSLRRPVAPGAALTPDALAVTRLIKRGDLITLVGRSGGLEVRAQGKALADGGSGERIPVENPSSRRVVQGVVRSGDTVDVGI